MFMQGDGYGVVSHLRVCLASAFYGNEQVGPSNTPVARVDSSPDPDEFLDGQSKLALPYIMCVPGDTNNISQTRSGAVAQTEMVERLEVYAVLSSKDSVIGRVAANLIHQVRLDLLKCLHNWNPFLAAKCQEPTVPYGYCTKNFIFSGDSFFFQDAERVVWVFDFDLQSTITAKDQGFGESNPAATEPLTHIHADFTPVDTDSEDHPFPVVHVHP